MRLGLLLLVLSVACASPAFAQVNQGHLAGVVKDAQGGVLPGVTVTATSPALMGTRVIVTEANGTYRVPALSEGLYTLTFELPGFQTIKREGIRLGIGQMLTVDVALPVASLTESVTVTSESPLVDTQSTSVGYVQTTAQLIGVPTSTDLWGALAQTPGVRMGGVDVGGSHKSQQSGYEAYGIRNQARVINEGIDTTEGNSGAGYYQDFFAQNEIAVAAAGGDVTMNTPGAAIIATIKSGGNEFKGLQNITYEGTSFVSDNIDADGTKRGFTGQPVLKFWEAHLELGGPILRDRAWFYVAYNHFKIDKVISGVSQSVATDLGLFDNWSTKESLKLGSKDTLLGYFQWARKQKPLRGLSVATPPESALAQDSVTMLYNGRWQRTWSSRMFTELNAGVFGYDWPMAPNVDYKTNPPRHDNGTGADSGAGWLNANGAFGPNRILRDKPQLFGTLTYYLPTKAGSHDFKTGFEVLNDQSYNVANGASGSFLYFDLNGALNQVRIADFGDPAKLDVDWTQATDYNRRYAAFFQDRWNASDRITVTAGLRYDRQRPYYTDANRVPVVSSVWPNNKVPSASILSRDTFSPRLGVSWDAVGDGKAVVKAFVGRFFFNLAQTLAAANPGGGNYKDFPFVSCSATVTANCDLNGNRLWDGPQETGGPAVASAGGSTTTADPNFKMPYADELEFSFDRQFWGQASARVAYVRKMVRNDYAVINAARIGQYTVPTTVSVIMRSFDGGIVGPQNFTLNDIPASLRGVTKNVIMNIPAEAGGGTGNYDTFVVAFNKRWSQGLFLNASFDYQRRNDLRTTSTGSTDPLNSDPIGVLTAGTSNPVLNPNPAVSFRQQTTTWTTHLSARYVFKYDIGSAINYSGQSGWPYSRVMTATLPVAGNSPFFLENLSNNRSDDVHLLAIRVDKAITVGRVKLTAMVDVFNLLNSNAVTNFNLSNGANFNKITATVDPRTVQLGFRLEF